MLHKTSLISGMCAAAIISSISLNVSAAVIASLKPVGFIAAAIADGVTDTEVLLPDGASEHDYALRPSDVKRLNSADLVVWVGLDMEAFMQKSLAHLPQQKQLALANLPAVQSQLIAGEDDHDHDHGDEKNTAHNHHHGEYNMHIWLSPEIARASAIAIHNKLVELMPQSRTKLDANLRDFEAQLAQTDKQVGSVLAPLKGKGYFVFHDAWGYFEKHYGLTSLGHFIVNPEIQPGAQRLHKIRTALVQHKAVCVFAEPQFRPTVVEAVARGTNVRMGTLDPLGTAIGISKDSYMHFLTQLSDQYASCLKGE